MLMRACRKYKSAVDLFEQMKMLGPAVNRQPGFRRELVEQSNAAKNNPAVGWLADCLLLLAAAGC